MTRIAKKELINKVFKVIRTCETAVHLDGAKQYVNLLFKSQNAPTDKLLAKRMAIQLNLKRLQLMGE